MTVKTQRVERLGLSMIVGSDSHFPETVGDAYTVVEASECSLRNILEAVRLGRMELFCPPSKIISKLRMAKHTIASLLHEQ